jgi:MFS family permease
MTPAEPATRLVPESRPAWLRFLDKFLVLKTGIRELWIVFIVKFIGIAAYAITNWTLVLWLSSDLGCNDVQASWLAGAWSVLITATTLLVGSLTDALGFRKTFFLGAWVCVVARGVMAVTSIKWLALGAGVFPLAIGEALSAPVLIASIRRYSTTRQRSIAFSISYAMMNLGFLAAQYLFDKIRHNLGEYGHLTLPFLGLRISTYRTLFLTSFGLEILLLPILYFLRPGAEATEEGPRFTPRRARVLPKAGWRAALASARQSGSEAVGLLRGLLSQQGFYRLLGFLVLIAFLKVIYKEIDYVYPKFGIRELGDGAPIGMLAGINNILIIFLAPLVGALTLRFSAYRMVVLGGAISAVSVFIMALPTAWFRPLANGFLGDLIGHTYLGLQGVVHPYYVMFALFMVVLSLGEAFYSPRVYEYAAAIAPKGQEASYGALSYVPFLLAKVFVLSSAGSLLETFCPEHGPRHSGTLWLIIALAATIAPIGLLVFRRYIRVHEAGRQD